MVASLIDGLKTCWAHPARRATRSRGLPTAGKLCGMLKVEFKGIFFGESSITDLILLPNNPEIGLNRLAATKESRNHCGLGIVRARNQRRNLSGIVRLVKGSI